MEWGRVIRAHFNLQVLEMRGDFICQGKVCVMLWETVMNGGEYGAFCGISEVYNVSEGSGLA